MSALPFSAQYFVFDTYSSYWKCKLLAPPARRPRSSAGLTCAYLTGRALQVLGFFIAHNFIAHYAVSLFRFVATLCFGTGVAFLILQGGGGSGSSALISARQLGVSFVNGLLLSAYLVGLFFGLQHAGTVRCESTHSARIF
jgi:hypothetical protein